MVTDLPDQTADAAAAALDGSEYPTQRRSIHGLGANWRGADLPRLRRVCKNTDASKGLVLTGVVRVYLDDGGCEKTIHPWVWC